MKDVRKSELHLFQSLSRSVCWCWMDVGVAIPCYFRDGMQTLVSSVSQTFCSNGIKRLLVFKGITLFAAAAQNQDGISSCVVFLLSLSHVRLFIQLVTCWPALLANKNQRLSFFPNQTERYFFVPADAVWLSAALCFCWSRGRASHKAAAFPQCVCAVRHHRSATGHSGPGASLCRFEDNSCRQRQTVVSRM